MNNRVVSFQLILQNRWCQESETPLCVVHCCLAFATTKVLLNVFIVQALVLCLSVYQFSLFNSLTYTKNINDISLQLLHCWVLSIVLSLDHHATLFTYLLFYLNNCHEEDS